MRTRRPIRRLLGWLTPALLILATTAGPGDKILHAQQQIGLPEIIEGPTQFILRASAADIEAIATRHGLTVLARIDDNGHDVFLVSGPAEISGGTGTFSALAEFSVGVQLDPQVTNFEPNATVINPEVAVGIELNHSTVEILDSLNNRTLVDHFGLQAWHGYVNQPATTAVRLPDTLATATGAGTVAIIDTGVDPTHPLLQGVLVPGYDFVNDAPGTASEWSDLDHSTVEILDHSTVEILDSEVTPVPVNPSTVAVFSSTSTLDPSVLPAAFGHGTMVAGIVHLVAPTAKIMPLKAFNADGTSRTFDIVRAIYYAVDHGARVINMSFSASAVSPEIARAINYATDRGVICVASAGNLGRESVVFPGGFRNVIGVASTNSGTTPVRSSFSNYGDSLVSLGAPGEGIITTYPGGGYAGAWGTSFSTPIVAGGAALLLQIDPALNFQKANDQFAKAIPMAPGMGKGRVNLFEAARTLPDVVAPAVNLLTPNSGGPLVGEVLVSASASDNVSVAGVKFLVDGSPLGVEDTSAPYELSWQTTAAANGGHVVTAIARDAGGNVASSTTNVTVLNDFAPPAIAFTGPSPGIFVSGTVTVSATASDDIGVVGVQFKLDGAPAGVEDVDPPYELSWNTGPVADGVHAWTAVARDASGKEATSTISVTVTHDVTPPTVAVTSPAADTTVAGTVTIATSASDDVRVTSVQVLVDGMPFGAPIASAPFETSWSTLGVANGTHTLTAVARDEVGHVTTASGVSVTVLNDLASPTVGLVTPAAGATVDGVVNISAAAADDIGVVSVQVLLDGAPLGDALTAAPYDVPWPTTTGANGAHTLTAVARDAAGRESTAAPVIVNVRNDLTAPTVSLASPAPGIVSGTVTLTATAVDDVGVTSVQFLVDGAPFGDADTESPYEIAWPTGGVGNGAHTLTVTARDGAGRETTTAAVTVDVRNDHEAPSVTVANPLADTTVAGTVTVTATAADDVGVTSVQFLLDGAPLSDADVNPPYEVAWPTLSGANGAHTLSAVARDGAGRETTAGAVSISVLNDLAAPTVALASPSAGTTVQGAITVTATADDDIAVTSVQFLLDGAPIGAPDANAPYEVAWTTVAASNGTHELTAVAHDAAGHETTAAAVSVTVLNDHADPTVAITSPGAGASVDGAITVTATAADDIGVTSVQFLLDGAALGAPDIEAPYEVAWSTLTTANGGHVVTALARDAAGREATATAVNVSVLNDLAAPTVVLASPSVGATLDGNVTVAATAADDVGVISVQFLLNGTPLGDADLDAPYVVAWPTSAVPNGAHAVTAVARDAAGRETASPAVSVTVLNDLTAPTVTLAAPSAGATVQGSVTVTATATDDIGVTGVQFMLDGNALGSLDTELPYQVDWSTSTVANGAHAITAVARDAAGRETTTDAVSVNVLNDLAAPTAALTSPSAGTTVSATVTLAATAADDIAVTSVQFLLDGAPLGDADTEAPYEAEWVTTSVVNGSHTIAAVARDAVGHATTASAVSVSVLNDVTAPAIGLVTPVAGATVNGVVTVGATATDDVGVTSVQFLLDGAPLGDALSAAPYQVEWPTTSTGNAAHTLTAIARDAAGRETTAAAVIVNVRNDLAAPTVVLASPSAGTTVNGTVEVTATAVDDVGVTSVQFLLDGAPLGDPDVEAPYAVSWPTAAVANGTHVLTALARDGAGRETTAETVSVAVLNDAEPPTVAVASPTASATVGGTVTVAATAADDVGVASVQFLLDGAPLGAADVDAPYEIAWPTLAVANGAHTLSAVARDGAGREATAATISVAVLNDTSAPSVALASPAASATVGGTVTVAATASDDVGVVSVQFLVDSTPVGAPDTDAPYEFAWPTLATANGAHTVSAVARDAAGRETTADVSVTVFNDVTAPTVSFASPTADAVVGGSVAVSATAADDVGVTSVQFLVDGAPFGPADTEAPYEVEWSTAAAANGAHTISAVARDAAGHVSTSTVSVTVLNDAAPPTVSMVAPAVGASVSGVVTVTATAADDIGVTSVQFVLDGTPLGDADVEAPYAVAWSTTDVGNGPHVLSAVARDGAGREATAATISVAVLNDTSAPSVALASPAASATVGGTVTVAATASDDVGVVSVQFLVDSTPVGAPDTDAPYEFAWPTLATANGAHTVSAVARDAAGRATVADMSVTVFNDVTAPTVSFASPIADAVVGGSVAVSATAADDVGVTSVQFLVDGAPFGPADTEAPYEVEWSTTAAANGAHTIGAVARDAAGHISTTTVSVTVVNDAAAPTVGLVAPTAGASVGGVVTVSASAADDVGVTSVQFLLDGAPLGAALSGAPYEVAWSTATAANGTHTLTAVARDAAGKETTSDAVTVTVLNDAAAPTVSVTSPAAEATVGGSVTIAATAADDIGVVSVQFLLDGAPLGEPDTEAPYEAEWGSTASVNGAHTITAVARDAAGHVTTTSVSATVVNDVTAPSVGLVTPVTGTTVEGVVTVSATAADDVGVTSVQFLLDGAPLGEAVTAAPYQVEWSTTTATNTAHTLTAIARDAAGRDATAATVIVNVRNDLAAPTVAFSTPVAEATVVGTITIAATAVDDVGVTSVQFLVDGAPIGGADTDAPYEVEWNSTPAANGAHTITVVARDAAGKETTSSISIVVSNEPSY